MKDGNVQVQGNDLVQGSNDLAAQKRINDMLLRVINASGDEVLSTELRAELRTFSLGELAGAALAVKAENNRKMRLPGPHSLDWTISERAVACIYVALHHEPEDQGDVEGLMSLPWASGTAVLVYVTATDERE